MPGSPALGEVCAAKRGPEELGSWEQEDLNFLLKLGFPNDGMSKPYKTAILVLSLDLFKLVLLNANITGIRNCVLNTAKNKINK